MEERVRVSRRQMLTLGGLIAVGAAVTGVSAQGAAAKPGGSHPESLPCLGEAGYEERVAKLFHLGDLPANPSTY